LKIFGPQNTWKCQQPQRVRTSNKLRYAFLLFGLPVHALTHENLQETTIGQKVKNESEFQNIEKLSILYT